MEEKTILSIPVMPFALMIAVIMAVIGLLIGILYAVVFGSIMAVIPNNSLANLGWFRLIFGVAAIIIMPIMMFIGGLLQGLLIAVIYNFLAPKIGGIKLRFK